MSGRVTSFFGVAFLCNVVWENLHYVLYVHYKGSLITEFVLLHASFVDMLYLGFTLVVLRFLKIQNVLLWAVPIWIIFAIGIEWWALETGRWAYASTMPIIPIIRTGLSPTVQLAVTGMLAYRLAFGTKSGI
ncbi:MAG: hypothetical protein AAB372_00940 [Patescibacteria group bacterium]